MEIDLAFYQKLYDSGMSLDKICREYPEAKYKRFFLQKNLKIRSLSKASSQAKAGKPLSQHHRDKISEAMKSYFQANPDEVPYRKYHQSKGRSYPERLFAEELTKQNITGWVQEFRNSIYTYDFAFPEFKIDVEIDGSTHGLPHVKKIDQKRDEWSRSQGWKVIRFTAVQVNSNVSECVKQLVTSFNSEAHGSYP